MRLNATEIRALLYDLGEELVRRGVRAEIFIVGGAAMAFAYNTRRSTRDVDAVFEPKAAVYAAAAAVADRRGIPADWLNDAAKSYLPGPDQDSRQALDIPGLTVDVASPKYLLAMKLLAARDDDINDIRTLYAACGYTTAAEGLDLLEATYPRHLLTPPGPVHPRGALPRLISAVAVGDGRPSGSVRPPRAGG